MNNKMKSKHVFILACLASSSVFAQSNQSDFKVSTNAIGGCHVSANNVDFIFYGTEGYKDSEYLMSNTQIETVWNNTQELNIKARCHKGAQVKLSTATPTYNNVGWIQLFHTVSPNNSGAKLLVVFPFKNSSQNIKKTSTEYVIKDISQISFNFIDGEQGEINFSAEVDHNIGEEFGFIPGVYTRDVSLNFDF